MNKNNVVLVGETGVGKRAIAEGLAQAIETDSVSPDLSRRSIAALNFSLMSTNDLKQMVGTIADAQNQIYFLDELHDPDGCIVEGQPLASFLKPLLLAGKMQCISAATPAGYAKVRASHPWLEQCFQIVRVLPLGEENSLKVLQGIKEKFEMFHDVTYSDEALKYAVLYSNRFVPGRELPEKAIDLIDDAGAAAKLRNYPEPDEVAEARKRIKFVAHREEMAVQNHEFEKARLYSDERRELQLKLQQLLAQYQIADAKNIVTRDDIEAAISRWTRLPVSKLREAVDADPAKEEDARS